jgi:hypothetical protein
MRDHRRMTRLRALALAITTAAAGGAGWACTFEGCDLATCSGGFQLSLRVDQVEADPITLEIEIENGRQTWTCNPGLSRCSRDNELEGDREFDVQISMVVVTVPFHGVPCVASACIDIEIQGESDSAENPGTYGPERVVVAIIDENGQQFSQDFEPAYERTEDYGGEGCGYCDSRESFDERASND